MTTANGNAWNTAHGGPPSDLLDQMNDRWAMLTRGVTRFAGETDISTVMSKRWLKVDGILEEFGAMLVEEVHDKRIGDDRTSEVDLLTKATEACWEAIKTHLIEFAVEVERRRVAGRAQAAAFLEPYDLTRRETEAPVG